MGKAPELDIAKVARPFSCLIEMVQLRFAVSHPKRKERV